MGRRGDSGRGWFQLYQEEGEEGFRCVTISGSVGWVIDRDRIDSVRYTCTHVRKQQHNARRPYNFPHNRRYRPPTPFDWEAAAADVKSRRTKCYLEVSVDKYVRALWWWCGGVGGGVDVRDWVAVSAFFGFWGGGVRGDDTTFYLPQRQYTGRRSGASSSSAPTRSCRRRRATLRSSARGSRAGAGTPARPSTRSSRAAGSWAGTWQVRCSGFGCGGGWGRWDRFWCDFGGLLAASPPPYPWVGSAL